MARADFHTHTTHSDGILSPTALVEKAAANGVTILSVTDHDSTDGITEAQQAGSRLGVHIVPGVELSADAPDGSDIHMLGYFQRVDDPPLQAQLRLYREGRQRRGRVLLEKLQELEMPLDWARVLTIAGEAAVGRPHVALAMVERGYVESVREAFDRYLHDGGPVAAPREKLPPEGAIQLIGAAGGVAVLAHPCFLPDPESTLALLVSAGIQGIEVYYKGIAPEEIARFAEMAARHGLIASGGSDYHGLHDDEREPGDISFADADVDRLVAALESHWAAAEPPAPGRRQA